MSENINRRNNVESDFEVPLDKKKRLFVDMDGTIARFHDNILDSEGHVQIELMYESEFFNRLEPFDNMIKAIKMFIDKYPEIEVFSLSAAQHGDPPGFVRQKDEWLDEFLPEIDRKHRIYPECGQAKSAYIPGGVSVVDFLLDDFNKNLREWVRDGGKSIKCKNNINHKGTGKFGGNVGNLWTGDMVSNLDCPEKILQQMEVFIGLTPPNIGDGAGEMVLDPEEFLELEDAISSFNIYEKWFEESTKGLPSVIIGSFEETKKNLLNLLDIWKNREFSPEAKQVSYKRIDEFVWNYGNIVCTWAKENPNRKGYNSFEEIEMVEKAVFETYQSYLNDIVFIRGQIGEHTSAGYYTAEQEKFLLEHVVEIADDFNKRISDWFSKNPSKEEIPLDIELGCSDKAIVTMAGKEMIMITANPVKENYPAVEIDISRRDLERVLNEIYTGNESWSIEDFLSEYVWDNGDQIKEFIELNPSFCKDFCKVTDFANAKYAVTFTDPMKWDKKNVYANAKAALYPEKIDEAFVKEIINLGYQGSHFFITEIDDIKASNILLEGIVTESLSDAFMEAKKKKKPFESLDDKIQNIKIMKDVEDDSGKGFCKEIDNAKV